MKLKRMFFGTIPAACLCLAGLCAPLVAGEPARHTFAIGTNDFLLDGQRFQIRCGVVSGAENGCSVRYIAFSSQFWMGRCAACSGLTR